jgi:hypothetical protein
MHGDEATPDANADALHVILTQGPGAHPCFARDCATASAQDV